MKFFWKIFFAFIALMTVGFSVFGMLIISQSFRNSLEKEIEEGNRENRMYQLAFEVNMNSLSENYRTEKIVRDLAESVIGNLDSQEYSYKLYREQDLIYENSPEHLDHQLFDQLGEDNCIYQVSESGEQKYLIFVCKSIMSERLYYLESIKDITSLYQERDDLYAQYRVVMLALIATSSIIVFILTHFLTKSVIRLSDTTRQFAQGDYEVRADVQSEDEIGTLAKDFNQMAESLNQRMEELTMAAQKQEDFTASFAHELKTPLTSIIGYADMLRTMDMSREETMEASHYIYSQGKRLESLSFKLLELIVTKNQDYQMKPLQVNELMEEINIAVSKVLEKKHIVLQESIEDGTVWGEKDLLVSLFTNLIDNARKALPEDGNIWLKGRKVNAGYEIRVKDNGCGMPREELDKITEAFYMVDKSRSRKEGGAGLGMTLCRRIVEVHKAKWYIRSEEGKGTEIWVVFPGEAAHEK
ncbi:MAG: HAMP domain-containing histidine kinase [Lachnospiraceae bacterium]|nr:HAMP domain-containing histidine kinase [Lachnospiraceae bacterium]